MTPHTPHPINISKCSAHVQKKMCTFMNVERQSDAFVIWALGDCNYEQTKEKQ